MYSFFEFFFSVTPKTGLDIDWHSLQKDDKIWMSLEYFSGGIFSGFFQELFDASSVLAIFMQNSQKELLI